MVMFNSMLTKVEGNAMIAVLIERTDGTIEVHEPTCRDIVKAAKSGKSMRTVFGYKADAAHDVKPCAAR